MTRFQRLCLITCVVVFGLIVLGGVVRATDSGLGCPDWPRCDGSFIPRWETHTLIEYSHRLTASVVGLLTLAIAVWAWRSYRRAPSIAIPAYLTFALVLFQGGLGGVAVLSELPPEIVTLHLGTALAILTLLLLTTVSSFARELPPARARVPRDLARLAAAAWVTTLALMLIGSYASGAGYGLACSGWPLCNGELIPGTNASSVQIVFWHRALALLVGVALVALVWLTWRSRQQLPFAYWTAGAALATYAVQALVGAANVWTRLDDAVSAGHLALGMLLWVLLTLLNVRLHHLHELLPSVSLAEGRPDLAGAAR